MQTYGDLLNTEIFTSLNKKNDPLLAHFAKTVAITLSKIGNTHPKLASNYLPLIIKPWCVALRYLNNKEEKELAFKGLC